MERFEKKSSISIDWHAHDILPSIVRKMSIIVIYWLTIIHIILNVELMVNEL